MKTERRAGSKTRRASPLIATACAARGPRRHATSPATAVATHRSLGLFERLLAARGEAGLALRRRGGLLPRGAHRVQVRLHHRARRLGHLAVDARLILLDELVALGHADLVARRGRAATAREHDGAQQEA